MAYWLMIRKASAVQAVLGQQTQVLRNLIDICTGWIARYQPLRERTTAGAVPVMHRRTMLAVAIAQNLVFFANLFPVHWEEQADATRLTRLAMVCILCCNALLVRDLHWRFLLQPGGYARGSLALRIYGATLQFAAIVLLSACLGMTLCDYLLLGKSPAAIQAGLERWAIVPLLAAVGVLVMALPHPNLTLGCSFVAALAVYVASLVAKLQTVRFEGMHTGPAYGAAMLLLAGLVMLLADRVWTPRRLLPYLPERPAGAAFSAAR